jgi:hypothetical protein
MNTNVPDAPVLCTVGANELAAVKGGFSPIYPPSPGEVLPPPRLPGIHLP